ncbi:cyclin-domain-containing protein [Sporodiniella umbellata]|nr:cyclin-domain-containing protein [Sporodiniella umbellata]
MNSLHFDLSSHPVKDTIKLLTSLLETITKDNDQLHLNAGQLDPSSYTCFHARSIPNISIHAYFTRILKYCPCANECLVALLVYFDRMNKAKPSRCIPPLHVDSYSIHRLIITGLMISSKLYSDVFFTNTRYAKVGGLPVAELNALELEFLCLNNYDLFVNVDELQIYGDKLLAHSHSQSVESIEINRNEEIIKPLGRLSMTESLPAGDNHWTYKKSNFVLKRRTSDDEGGLRTVSAVGSEC